MSLIPRPLLEITRIVVFSLVLVCVIGTTLFFLQRYAGINTDLTFFLSLLPAVSLVVGWVGYRIDNLSNRVNTNLDRINGDYDILRSRVENLSISITSIQQNTVAEMNTAKLERDRLTHGLISNRARLDAFYRAYGEESDLKEIKGIQAQTQMLLQDLINEQRKLKE